MLNLIYGIILAILNINYSSTHILEYNDSRRITIITLTYPLLIYSIYNLSIKIHLSLKIDIIVINLITNIVLSSLILSYLQQDRLLFDPDDRRREINIIISGVLIIENLGLISNKIIPKYMKDRFYKLWIA